MGTETKATRKPREYVVDEHGQRKAVLVPVEEYEALLEAAQDLEDIRAADEARAESGEDIPLEEFEAQLRAEGKLA
jgi:PHD/YefM family antitoxin component YafN of YafNO toxin-antitoxin module